MSDLIDRQAAIEIVRHRCKRLTTACVLAVTEIEQLPSAQPQRKMGKWMSVSDEMQTWYHCSECHYQQYDKTNFCPSCGADMDGENDA